LREHVKWKAIEMNEWESTLNESVVVKQLISKSCQVHLATLCCNQIANTKNFIKSKQRTANEVAYYESDCN